MAPPWHQLICFPKKITKILTWAPHRQGKRWPLLWYLGAWVVTEAARPTSKIVAWILGGSISLCITGELKWFWVWYGPCSSHWSKSLELGWVRSVYVHGPDLITWLHTSKLLALMSLQAVHVHECDEFVDFFALYLCIEIKTPNMTGITCLQLPFNWALEQAGGRTVVVNVLHVPYLGPIMQHCWRSLHWAGLSWAGLGPRTTLSASRSQPGKPLIMLLPKYFLQVWNAQRTWV